MKTQHVRAWRGVIVLAWVALLGFAPGCARKTEPTTNEAYASPQPAPTAGEAREYDADQLDALVTSLERKARSLPGRTAEQQRDAMREVFDDLAKLLPILEGPEPSGAFRQEMRTLTTARDRLAGESEGAAIGSSVDTGLRAASAMLERIGRDDPYANDAVKKLLDDLTEKVAELDKVRPIGRPYIAADATGLIAQVCRQILSELPGEAASTAAATDSAASTTAPATQPAEGEPAETATEPAADSPAPESPPAEEPAPEPAPEPAVEVAPEPAPEPAPEAPAAAEDLNK